MRPFASAGLTASASVLTKQATRFALLRASRTASGARSIPGGSEIWPNSAACTPRVSRCSIGVPRRSRNSTRTSEPRANSRALMRRNFAPARKHGSSTRRKGRRTAAPQPGGSSAPSGKKPASAGWHSSSQTRLRPAGSGFCRQFLRSNCYAGCIPGGLGSR